MELIMEFIVTNKLKISNIGNVPTFVNCVSEGVICLSLTNEYNNKIRKAKWEAIKTLDHLTFNDLRFHD